MIAIKFHPQYEDRVNIFMKHSKLNEKGINFTYTDTPEYFNDNLCFWTIKYTSAKQVNFILSLLIEMKAIMGIDDLEFSFASNDSEYYTQFSSYENVTIKWFKV